MTLRKLAVACAVLGAGAFTESVGRRQDERRARRGTVVSLPGGAVNVYAEGEGPEAVVIVTGAGDTFASWFPIQHVLAQELRVVGYDRPGIGASAPGAPPTAPRYLAELDRVIDLFASGGPVTLVGHSLGGLLARLYARQHPSKVQGIVLVDATPPHVANDLPMKLAIRCSAGLVAALKGASCFGLTRALFLGSRVPLSSTLRRYRAGASGDDYDQWLLGVRRSINRSVHRELLSSIPLAQLEFASTESERDPISRLPLVVLGSHAFGKRWRGWQQELAELSPQGRFVSTGSAAHNVHLRHPNLVVNAVRNVGSTSSTVRRPESQRPTEEVIAHEVSAHRDHRRVHLGGGNPRPD